MIKGHVMWFPKEGEQFEVRWAESQDKWIGPEVCTAVNRIRGQIVGVLSERDGREFYLASSRWDFRPYDQQTLDVNSY